MHWLWLPVLLAAGAAAAAGPQTRWSPPDQGRARALGSASAEDLEAAESEWVPLAAPCPTCRPNAAPSAASVASVFDDGDLGLTPPKAPVVQRQIFSARQPSFFPQDFPSAMPSHAPFFPAASPAAPAAQQQPQGKQLFGAPPPQQQQQQQQQQPGANQFLQQIGIPDNLQQFILSPPKQDFPLPNVQQVLLGQQQSSFGQPLLPFSLPHNAPAPPQPPQRPPPPPPPAQLPLQSLAGLNASQPNQKEEVQLLYVPVETLRQRGQLGGPQPHQQRFLPPQPQQQPLQPQPQASSQFAAQASPGQQPPRAQSHVLQYHPQNPNGQFTLSLNHPPNPFQQQFQHQPPQQQQFQHQPQFQHFPQQQFRQPPPPQQQQFREPPQQTFREQPPPPQFQPHHHHFQQFQQFPPQQFQQQPQQQQFPGFPPQHRFALPSPSTPAPPANHQFSFVQQTPATATAAPPTAAPTTPAPHQPPLSVYMSPNNLRHDTKITDVLQLLKNARTIPVLDNVSPDSPQVFVGPANLHPPKGYAKFELPYLSSLDTNRVERKVNKLPFFVAPLSFQPPPGYSKILLPPPHIGSVVVNSNVSSSAPQQVTALPQLHEKDVVFTKTTPAPPAVQSTVTFSLPSEITPVNPRLPTLVNSLDEGRTAEQLATTPVSPVSHTTPRRQPFLRPTSAASTAPPQATPTPTARSTPRRPAPTRPTARTTEAAPTESFTSAAPSVTPSPELASAAPDQADPSFQSQRVNLGAGAGAGSAAKRGRKRLRQQHRLNGLAQQQALDDPVRSSTEALHTLSPTTESVLPARFSPENINLLQDAVSFPTERPAFGSFQQTDRPSFGSTPFRDTERPAFQPSERPSFLASERPSFLPSERPSFQQTDRPSSYQQTERPGFSSTPFQPSERPSFLPSERPSFQQSERPSSFNSFQTEAQPSFTERPSFSPSFTPSSAPVFPDVTTERAILQPASINGFLQPQQQAEDPQSLNQIQQQEFFPTRLENGKVQYQYNLQQQQAVESPEAPAEPQADFQPTFVRLRGRIQTQQQQPQQPQQPLLPHVPVELQKAVRVNRPSAQDVQTTSTGFGQDTVAPSGPGANLAVRVRGKIRSRPRHQFQQQQQQQQQQAEEVAEQPQTAPEQFLKETVIERSTTTTSAPPTASFGQTFGQDVSVPSQTEASLAVTTQQQQQQQQQAEQEVASVTPQQVSEEPQSETTQPSTSTTRAGVRKYNNFVRTGAPRRPGLRQPTAAPATTTTTTTQRPRGSRRPAQLATSGAVGVRGRIRSRPTTTTEASSDAAEAPAAPAANPELYGRRRGPGSRTPPSALSNEVLDSDHQESVQPPRSTAQRFDVHSRRPAVRHEEAPAAPSAPEQSDEQPQQPARVRVRRPGHRRQPSTTPSAPGADQSHADSKLAFALDNGDVGKDSQYGEKHGAVADEALPTVPALEAHPTFDWSAHSGSSLKNGWSAASSGNPQDLPPIQYSVSGAQGEVDAKPSEHSDDPSDYLEPSHGRPSRPAQLDAISAQDVDNVMKALEEVGLLDENASASPAPASGPEQDILKEDSHKKAADPTTQKKSGGRRRGSWVRVRVKRPRDGLATAESQNGASFPGNSVLGGLAPAADAKTIAKDSIVFDKVSPSAPSPSAADVDLTAPTTTGVSFADDVVTALGEEQDAEATATTPRISSQSIAADAAEDAVRAVEPSAEPSPAEPASTSEPSAPSTFAPVTSGSSDDDAADLLRVSTTAATPGSDGQDEAATTVATTTTTAGAKQAETEQDQLNKFLGSTTSTKVSMETEICFRGRCIKTKGDKKRSEKPEQVPVE